MFFFSFSPQNAVLRLQECFESGAPEFWEGIHVINYSDWPSVLSTTLYDEEKQKFV